MRSATENVAYCVGLGYALCALWTGILQRYSNAAVSALTGRRAQTNDRIFRRS
jgi:hypothetical protein